MIGSPDVSERVNELSALFDKVGVKQQEGWEKSHANCLKRVDKRR